MLSRTKTTPSVLRHNAFCVQIKIKKRRREVVSFDVSIVPIVHYGVLMKNKITVAFCDVMAVSAVTVMTVFPKPTIIPEETVTESPAAMVGIVPFVVFPRRRMPPERLIHQGTFVTGDAPLFLRTTFTLNNPPVIVSIEMVGLMMMVSAGDRALSTPFTSFALHFIVNADSSVQV